MQVSGFHSHLNGYEFIRVHVPHLWNAIYAIVRDVNAEECISTRGAHPCYSATRLRRRMARCLIGYGWQHIGARSRIQTKFVKNRVAINVGFGKEPLGPYGLLTNHIGQYASDVIDVGIEILPTKHLSENLSARSGSYEEELGSLSREGRGVPGVPLVLIGVAP